MKKILLVGGAGYVGTVLTSYFLKRGYIVSVIDNFTYENHNAIQSFLGDENYEFFNGDFGKNEHMDCVSKDIDFVVILAGLVGDPITKKYPEASYLTNELGVISCIDYFDNKSIENLIFISTCSNYGLIQENELADEEFALNPLSLYAKAKVAAELHLLSKKNKVSYTASILRFATAFGLSPRMRFDLSISEFVRDLYFGNELLVFDEYTWRPYCHVRDFARLIELVITAEKDNVEFQVFNAGGDKNNFTKKMIVDTILKYIPDAKIRYGSNGSDPRNYKVSFEKVKNILGFEPRYTIEDGILELITALKLGVYNESIEDKNKFGNYEIKY